MVFDGGQQEAGSRISGGGSILSLLGSGPLFQTEQMNERLSFVVFALILVRNRRERRSALGACPRLEGVHGDAVKPPLKGSTWPVMKQPVNGTVTISRKQTMKIHTQAGLPPLWRRTTTRQDHRSWSCQTAGERGWRKQRRRRPFGVVDLPRIISDGSR